MSVEYYAAKTIAVDRQSDGDAFVVATEGNDGCDRSGNRLASANECADAAQSHRGESRSRAKHGARTIGEAGRIRRHPRLSRPSGGGRSLIRAAIAEAGEDTGAANRCGHHSVG